MGDAEEKNRSLTQCSTKKFIELLLQRIPGIKRAEKGLRDHGLYRGSRWWDRATDEYNEGLGQSKGRRTNGV